MVLDWLLTGTTGRAKLHINKNCWKINGKKIMVLGNRTADRRLYVLSAMVYWFVMIVCFSTNLDLKLGRISPVWCLSYRLVTAVCKKECNRKSRRQKKKKSVCVFFNNNNTLPSLTKATRTQAIDHQITSTVA